MTGDKRFQLLAAVHLFLIRDGDILMLRRFQTGYEDGSYSVPAGHLDGGETIKAAMIREAKEECGIDIAEEDLAVAGVMHRRSDDERIDFFLTAAKWSGAIVNAEPHKCDDLRWFPRNALPVNTIPYVRFAMHQVQSGQVFSSYGWDE
jgi:ADP-ribose pyrophosphatase YjhB (NUDIX family)